MAKYSSVTELVGRLLIAVLFIPAGFSKISAYEGMQGYMESMGVPGALLPLVILAEIGGGLAILIGFQTRLVALALAAFCVIAGVLFHYQPQEQIQMILFMKNIAVAGGLLLLVASGSGALSVDSVLKNRKVAAAA